MNNLFDVQQLLKMFGIYVYLGKRLYDIELMDIELNNLHQAGLIDDLLFRKAKIVLVHEHNLEKNSEG